VPPADPYSSGGQVYLEEGSQVKSNPSSTASDDSRDEREGPRGARLLDTSSRFFTLPLNVFSATASGKVPVAWLRTRGVASALELDSYSGVAALYARRHSSAPFVRALPPASPLHSAWWFPHPYASAYLNGQYVNLSCHFMQTNRTGQLKEHLR